MAFRAVVQETHVRFRLGENEQATTFAEITVRLSDGALAELMRRRRADEDGP